MSTKYAEGPWYGKVNEFQGLVISEATGATVAVVYDVKDTDLVAAAPELLEALEDVVRISDRKHDAWDRAHTAIAKAKGLK